METIPTILPRRFHVPFNTGSMRVVNEPSQPSAISYLAILNSVEEARETYFGKVLPVFPPGQLLTPRRLQIWLPDLLKWRARGTITCGLTRIGSETFDWVGEVKNRHTEKTVALVLATFGLVDMRSGTAPPLAFIGHGEGQRFRGCREHRSRRALGWR